jgi:hypothetical protein
MEPKPGGGGGGGGKSAPVVAAGGAAAAAADAATKKSAAAATAGAGKDSKGGSKKQPLSAVDAARRSELARKNAAREVLRRKAERRVYRPASAWIVGKLLVMYAGLAALVFVDVFLTALGCYVNPVSQSMHALGNYTWNCLCCFSLLGLPALLVHLAGYVFLPPVWGESFPQREKVLEELGGKLYFRFHWTRQGPELAA